MLAVHPIIVVGEATSLLAMGFVTTVLAYRQVATMSTAARRRCDGESNAGDNGYPGPSRIRLDQHAGTGPMWCAADVADTFAVPGTGLMSASRWAWVITPPPWAVTHQRHRRADHHGDGVLVVIIASGARNEPRLAVPSCHGDES